jgi:FtsH-binding integral membrane protein
MIAPLALYIFGTRVEQRIGSRHFISLYLASGIAGGLLSVVFAALTPGAYIVGASGAVFGLISHTFPGGRRDFSSVGGMRADSYDVVADEEVAEEASRLLAARS